MAYKIIHSCDFLWSKSWYTIALVHMSAHMQTHPPLLQNLKFQYNDKKCYNKTYSQRTYN
jgi:hypothetical protein